MFLTISDGIEINPPQVAMMELRHKFPNTKEYSEVKDHVLVIRMAGGQNVSVDGSKEECENLRGTIRGAVAAINKIS